MSDESIEALCKHCGQALTDFLHEMEEHNAEVVCPACGKKQDRAVSPPKDTPNPHSDSEHRK